jgi:TrmH family RNA methyltransferase
VSGSPLDAIRIVLHRPKGAANVGGVARALANGGLSRLVVVAPREELTHPDTVNWAAGAGAILAGAQVATSLEQALEGTVLAVATTARPRHLTPRADIRVLAPRLIECATSGEVAIVFGPEDHGLTGEEIDLCQEIAVIPSAPAHPSLNLAAAVLLVTHELFRAAAGSVASEALDLATHEERMRLVARCREIIDLMGYRNLGKSYSIDQTIQRLALRGRLERRDLRNVLAVLRHIEWVFSEGRVPKKNEGD